MSWDLPTRTQSARQLRLKNDLDWIAREKVEEMTHNEATKFRRADARLNYLALDRPDLGVAAGRLSRCMARPRVSDVQTLKKGTQISERATNVGYHLHLAACPGGAGRLD